MAAARGRSTRCGRHEGEGSWVWGLGKKELPPEARVLVDLLSVVPNAIPSSFVDNSSIAALEPFAAPRD
jgi:hypothetical protein